MGYAEFLCVCSIFGVLLANHRALLRNNCGDAAAYANTPLAVPLIIASAVHFARPHTLATCYCCRKQACASLRTVHLRQIKSLSISVSSTDDRHPHSSAVSAQPRSCLLSLWFYIPTLKLTSSSWLRYHWTAPCMSSPAYRLPVVSRSSSVTFTAVCNLLFTFRYYRFITLLFALYITFYQWLCLLRTLSAPLKSLDNINFIMFICIHIHIYLYNT